MTADPASPEEAAVARFDPMLRSLITFGLVESDDAEEASGEGASGQWRLIPAVQRRLWSLASPTPPADKLVYFGHRCGACGEHAPTWLIAGEFLCTECRQSEEAFVQTPVALGS